MTAPRAVVLLSGGMDSATAGAVARHQGFELYALSFRYGQRHAAELEAAGRVAKWLGARRHVVLDIDLRALGGSALTGDLEVPNDTPLERIGDRIPATYGPARNTIFLSFALGWAEVLGADDIFIGANALDYSGYPDCRPEYLEAFERMAGLATRAGVEGRRLRIHSPLIALTKAEIVKLGRELGVDYGMTWSCYDPSPEGTPCGRCDACLLREKGFREAGVEDPAGAPDGRQNLKREP
ncbi:MAG TPA: 7-cyano-7-deazaguanine synthase QueC [Gemmatimonadales bacterium]|nr:7-cyano-7-deazaguanine synthase QueC [Gemmatimonadales bacterium]